MRRGKEGLTHKNHTLSFDCCKALFGPYSRPACSRVGARCGFVALAGRFETPRSDACSSRPNLESLAHRFRLFLDRPGASR